MDPRTPSRTAFHTASAVNDEHKTEPVPRGNARARAVAEELFAARTWTVAQTRISAAAYGHAHAACFDTASH